MRKLYAAVIGSFLLLCTAWGASAQQVLVSDSARHKLANLSAAQHQLFQSAHQHALALAKSRGWAILRRTKNGGIISLQGTNSLGFPVYLVTDNNTIAAATTQTNTVQPGGSLGLDLSGSSTFLNDKLAIWDGGSVYKNHQEFAGKTITIEDKVSVIDHATHVSGTMIAKGVYQPAKGMAFAAATLHSYYFDNDITKMSAAAPGLLLSNHSYGDEAGWNYNDAENRWEWFGLPGDSVDYTFGFYGDRTKQFDQIAFNAPYYLIVESAGNAHAYPGPAIGDTYYGYKSKGDQTFVNKGKRPAGISSNDGYDVISATGNAKNILTVGAINPLPNGPAGSSDISVASFSSWGPTDDGRVKPDIVADGVGLLSCGSSGPADYISLSGTSMAAPNVTGSLYLLQEYYAKKNGGKFMRAATLKGLACHTAFDAGNAGPDYIYGWGLLDMKKAAQALTDNGVKSEVIEKTLQQGQQQVYNVTASGDGPLRATISWTDPAGVQTTEGTVNSRTPKLVNDLDIRVSDGAATFYPWILDPSHPSATAQTGDNIRDNVEQVYIPGAVPGRAYTITVSHKGALPGGSQDYSIIITGIGGRSYCQSAPLSSADSKVNNLTLSNLNYTAPAGCASYTDNTTLTAQLEQGRTYPLSITLGTCGANLNKAAKIFIDWNGDGIFSANELVATTNVISATGTYNTNITVPLSVTPNNFSLMRVVLTETSDASLITPCGPYGKGETLDYRVHFLQTTTDAGITAITSPDPAGTCASVTAITVAIKNFGSQPVSNIPVTVTVTAPGNLVTTFHQTYTGTIQPGGQDNFTITGTLNAVAGAAYTIVAATSLANDPVTSNDQLSETVTVSPPPVASNLLAYYCDNTKKYELSGTGDGTILWYAKSNDAVPFAWGSPADVTHAPVDNTYYAGINDFSGSIGPAAKTAFTGGGYNQFTPYVKVSTKIPVVIESARLYIGNSGKITFNVATPNGQIVSSTTINAVATRSNPLPGAQPDDPNDQGAVYPLNLLLPAAGDYTINIVYDDSATIFRNDVGVTGYPFHLGNVFSITGNNAQSGADTTYYKGFYYYFYDMKVKSAGCPSVQKQPVMLTKATVTQAGTSLTSNFTAGNQWYLDGNPVTAATGQTYVPKQSGNYRVGVTLGTGCQLLSDNFVYVLAGSQGNNSDIGLVIYPIPADSELHLVFAAKAPGTLGISLVSAAGRIVYTNQQAINAGNFSTIIDVSAQPPGTYILKLLLGQKAYYNKIIIVN